MIDRMTVEEALDELRAAGYDRAVMWSVGAPAIYLNARPGDKQRIMVAPSLRLVDCEAVWRAVWASVVG